MLENGYYGGAFYLSGYSVELYLKAKICLLFDVPDLFAKPKERTSPEAKQTEGINDIVKSVKIHDLTALLMFSRLKLQYKKLDNKKMKQHTTYLIRKWTIDERYEPYNPVERKKITNTINNLEEFLKWIKNN